MLISDKQQEANRQNAQQSTGPKTPEGKAAVRLNALTYGLRARNLIPPTKTPRNTSISGPISKPSGHWEVDICSRCIRSVRFWVARAVCQKREAHLSVRNVNRETVRLTRPRFHATCPPGALLHERHAGIEAVTKGAAGPAKGAAGAASATRASRKTSGSAPCLCDVGGHRGPSSLLFPRHPRYRVSNLPPLIFDNRTNDPN